MLLEDESGVHAVRGGERTTLAAGAPVRLPDFAGHPHAALLRRMHADLLLCCTPFGPVPNPWVYTRPWYRDAAMLALVFRETGNLPLLRDWILGLRKPYDRNNAGWFSVSIAKGLTTAEALVRLFAFCRPFFVNGKNSTAA